MTSRWAAFKLDCSETDGDRLLHTVLAPFAAELERDGLIRHWFFVRVADPAPHLHVRFALAGDDGLPALSARVRERFANAAPDTYERELERYGEPTLELSERMFRRDSEMAARAIALVHEIGDEELRWQFALLAMTRMLDDFAFSLREQLHLLEAARETLLAEHGEGKAMAAQINQEYRAKRRAIDEALDPERHRHARWPEFVELLTVRDHATASERFQLLERARAGRLTVSLRALHASYVQMFCNRLFPSRPRFHELVLVTFLAKRIHRRLARSG